MRGNESHADTVQFKGNRDDVRRQAVDYSLKGIIQQLDNKY